MNTQLIESLEELIRVINSFYKEGVLTDENYPLFAVERAQKAINQAQPKAD